MDNEEILEKVPTPPADEEFDAIKAINDLRENSVPKDEFEKLKAERNKYLKALIDGSKVDTGEVKNKESVDEVIKNARQKLFSQKEDLSNLEYVETALALRAAILERDGTDIFVGNGSKTTPTAEDYQAAEKVASVLTECVETANGNSAIFTRELDRLTRDAMPKITRRR